MKVLIGYDGSACSDLAIDDLARAGLPAVGEAVVLAATDLSPPVPAVMPSALAGASIGLGAPMQEQIEEFTESMVKHAESRAKAGAERFSKLFPQWQVKPETAATSPSSALVEYAGNWKSDLLVVGSHGHSAIGRLLLGSVAQSVLHYARCTVRIARGRTALAQEPARIVLGVDGSAGSELAAKAIALRNWPHHSAVRVMAATCLSPLELAAGHSPNTSASLAKALQESCRSLEQAARRQAQYLRDHGLEAVPILHNDSPRHVLLREAETWDADCIFVGARGLSRLERLLLGSVSGSVAAQAKCSVEVVR